MAELLVRVVDKINHADFYLNCQCTKRGDVIVVCPDGWVWGTEELANPDWRILQIPHLSVSEASVFLAHEPERTPEQPSKTLQRRAFKLDVDAASWPAEVAAWLADATRAAPTMTVTEAMVPTSAILTTLKVERPPIDDPAVLGPSSRIF